MKRTLSLILALLMCIGLVNIASAAEATLDGGMTYAEGYPITKEVVELDAWVSYNVQQNVSEMVDVLKFIEEKTNIRLNLTLVYEADEVAMMFASGDYPDFIMNVGATDIQRLNAVDAGDVICLDDYMEYMPTWKSVFERYTLSNSMTLINGKRYTLPWCNFDYSDRNMRDAIIINRAWLDELGIEKPTTIQAFTDYLQAVKDHAGTGTIPENVIPFEFRFSNEWWNGAPQHLFAQFGLFTSNQNWLFAKDGIVTYQAIDPLCKDALHYIKDLYNRGLLTAEAFTDDQNTYYARVCATDPAQVGAHIYYTGYRGEMDDFIGPLDSGNGQTALMNSQTYTPNSPHNAMVFKGTKYPVAIARLFEFVLSSQEALATVNIGSEGKLWQYNAEGKIEQIADQQDSTYLPNRGFWNTWVGVFDGELFYDNYQINSFTDGGFRKLIWYDVYKGKTVPTEYNFAGGPLDVDKTALLGEYWTDINNHRLETWTRWVTTDADIDAEWDAYVAEAQGYHLAEYIALQQEAYDLIH